jgi:benzoyl-CoA reductase/2-hydroxyglutaryl-CoA dehydratase subunit BcrC/BadD/HgdB
VEAHLLREHCDATLNRPYLHLETDYAEHDTQQLKTRIEAFLEMVK